MSATRHPPIWWVRRDLRLADNPALRRAIDDGDGVLPLFVLDPALLAGAGTGAAGLADGRAARPGRRSARRPAGPGLSVVRGKPVDRRCRGSRKAVERRPGAHRRRLRARTDGAATSGSPRRSGRARSRAGRAPDRRTRSRPGTLFNKSGDPFQVFTPFHRTWLDHGVHDPASAVRASSVDWLEAENRVDIPPADDDLIEVAGESGRPPVVAGRGWRGTATGWPTTRSCTTSPAPTPPRTCRSPCAGVTSIPVRCCTTCPSSGPRARCALARQIAWRDFFADVLLHRPDAVSEPVKPEYKKMTSDEPEQTTTAAERLKAWQEGRTGYPLVDAVAAQRVGCSIGLARACFAGQIGPPTIGRRLGLGVLARSDQIPVSFRIGRTRAECNPCRLRRLRRHRSSPLAESWASRRTPCGDRLAAFR